MLPTYSNTPTEHKRVLKDNMEKFVSYNIDIILGEYTEVEKLHKMYCSLYGDIDVISFGKAFKQETDISSTVKTIDGETTRVYPDVVIKETINLVEA
jgi:hypothetical protein